MTKYLLSLCLFSSLAIFAAQAATIHGIVHDPQHRPIPGATIVVSGPGQQVSKTIQSDENGEFQFGEIPEGVYAVTVTAAGFSAANQQVTASAGNAPVLHFQLELATVSTSVEVTGAVNKLNAQTSTVQSTVTPEDIQQTPGADQSNSLSMITNFVPGAYMVHDMLHMRGGHQVNWFFDGIPVINTNIAANVAPLINPKNIESLEVQRGGSSSEYGDRTYGFLNVVTPSGFDRNNGGELVTSFGNFHTTDDQINFGSHTDRFAYYASVDGNRSDLGLSNPTSAVIHDATSGSGGFLSLMYNATPNDQFRWIGSLRANHYQIPNDPDSQAAGIRDLVLERDYMGGFQWTHTWSPDVLLSISPYYHFNEAHYIGGPSDTPFILDDNNRSHYVGTRIVFQTQKKRHNARVGTEVWEQSGDALFSLTSNPGGQTLQPESRHWANSETFFLEDQYKATSWLTLDLGVRMTHYSGLLVENTTSPRVGGSIRLPHINWVLHGYYSYYYQPPPLDSVTGPLLAFAVSEGFGFTPLPGEHDIQHDVGISIPVRGWDLDVDNFHTSVRNFLDHDVLGDSGIFVPLSDLAARISGTEVALRSPRLFHRAQARFVYSNQIARAVGPITGGLLQDAPTDWFFLDHDQRNTMSAVFSISLPDKAWATPVVSFGSGFLDGDGPDHLPPHTTVDLSLGKSFGEKLAVSLNGTNLANHRYLLDNSNTFGGTHTANPRQVYVEVRYKFHF